MLEENDKTPGTHHTENTIQQKYPVSPYPNQNIENKTGTYFRIMTFIIVQVPSTFKIHQKTREKVYPGGHKPEAKPSRIKTNTKYENVGGNPILDPELKSMC